MIGDTEKDIEAAKNAEIDSILFYHPEYKKFYSLEYMNSHDPTHVIDDFKKSSVSSLAKTKAGSGSGLFCAASQERCRQPFVWTYL